MLYLLFAALLLGAAAVAFVVRDFRKKNVHIWLASYLQQRRPHVSPEQTVHVMFAFVDHYEPKWGRPSAEVETERVNTWCERYRELASRHQDADGVHPQHSFFYPEEEYEVHHLDALAKLCADGYGEIEVHLHHDNDTADGLRQKINGFRQILTERHGALPFNSRTKQTEFAFIHGNWALDNSRADGRWCGVNDEIKVLAELGCYADFTLPSAPSDTQVKKINSIYYATDDCCKPRSHEDGVDVEVGRPASGDLMIVQGPLGFNFKSRKWGLIPRIENADVRLHHLPSEARNQLWRDLHIHVKGRPEWVFIKVHTHGCQEADMDALLGAPAEAMYADLERRFNDGKRHQLHYVSAREMVNIIKAAEDGKSGNPNQYRDYILQAPPSSRAGGQRPH
jgi:hypothetical protein